MIFKSKYAEHRLIMSAQRVELTNFGRNLVPGKTIEFQNYMFKTEDKDQIEFLKNHPSFNVEVFEIPSEEAQEDAMIAKAEAIKAKREKSVDKVAKVEAIVKKAKK